MSLRAAPDLERRTRRGLSAPPITYPRSFWKRRRDDYSQPSPRPIRLSTATTLVLGDPRTTMHRPTKPNRYSPRCERFVRFPWDTNPRSLPRAPQGIQRRNLPAEPSRSGFRRVRHVAPINLPVLGPLLRIFERHRRIPPIWTSRCPNRFSAANPDYVRDSVEDEVAHLQTSGRGRTGQVDGELSVARHG